MTPTDFLFICVKEKKLNIKLYQIKRFCIVKKTINKAKRQVTEWKKIFGNRTSYNGLMYKIYKKLIQHNIKNPNNPI